MARRSRLLHRRRQYWYFKYKDQGGNWREQTTHKTNYQLALEERERFLRELADGESPNDRSKWTLEDAILSWMNHRKLRVARSTYLSELTITRNLLRVLGAGITLTKLADIQCVKNYESVRLAGGTNPKTVNNEVQVLSAILRDASLWQRIANHYKPLKVPKSDVAMALTRDEGRRLLEFAATADTFAVAPFAAVLAYAAGLRSGELANSTGSLHCEHLHPARCRD